jgi:hypothetical protein
VRSAPGSAPVVGPRPARASDGAVGPRPGSAAAVPPSGSAPVVDDDQDVPVLPSLSVLAAHSRLWRWLPSEVWPRFRDLSRPSLQAYLRASRDGDSSPRATALVSFLRIPQLALALTRWQEGKAGPLPRCSAVLHF